MSTDAASMDKGIVPYLPQPTATVPPFRDQTRLTVTIKMLMEAFQKPRDQGRLVINNSQVHTVQLCGRITSIEHGDAWTDYELYDGTGSIPGRVWSRDPEGWTDMSSAIKGTYYIVNGTVATRYDVPKIDTIIAREVTDHNEITVHNLTVIHEHLYLKDRYESVQVPKLSYNRARVDIDKEAIVTILSRDEIRATEEGASEAQLMDALKMDENSLREALEGMLNEGVIYNTTDDIHYKLADN